MVYVIAAFSALMFFLMLIFLWLFFQRRQSVDIFHRLRRHNVSEGGKLHQNEDIVRRIYLFIQHTAKPIAEWNVAKNLDFKLKQAGIPIFGAEFIVIVAIGSILGSLTVYVITFNISIAPLAGLAVPLFLLIWVRMRINKRREAFTEQLGDCLTTVANALRAGYSFQQAMDVVAKEMEPPMSTEFERVSTDVAMGVALEEALDQMNKRIGSADFDLVVTAVLIQREIGGNLAQILDTISYTINERIRMKREISALTAQGRFSAWVLLLLPFAVAIFCWFFNHDQMMLFITEEIGRIAIAVAIIMEILGFIVIQRIVDIEL
ncbi:MAG: type II secretion system F family protein [Quinella sp. 2Q5]|nr:type II secretion system F family protein [Quinella sp. 2Q5]